MTENDLLDHLRNVGCDRMPFTPEHADCKCRLASKAAKEIERLRGALEKAIPWMALAAVALPVGQAIRQEEIDSLTLHLAEARSTLSEVRS